MSKDLNAEIKHVFEDAGKRGLWRWAMAPDGAHRKAKRFALLAHFAGNMSTHERFSADERHEWEKAQVVYRTQRDKFERRYERNHADDAEWPKDLTVAECLYHPPGPHFHLASPDRNALIQIGRIAQKRGCRVGEFPPFDTTEPVHTGGSWHYRDPSRPYTPIEFVQSKLVQGGPWGLAADINDLDGGSDQEYALYLEVRARYL